MVLQPPEIHKYRKYLTQMESLLNLQNNATFTDSLPNHRQGIKIRHLSTAIIFITVAVIICGATDRENMEYFGPL